MSFLKVLEKFENIILGKNIDKNKSNKKQKNQSKSERK
tara:strand:+ start:198 stop:311 length:114 start_codon:yes stop_codon:yes gene_type:complete